MYEDLKTLLWFLRKGPKFYATMIALIFRKFRPIKDSPEIIEIEKEIPNYIKDLMPFTNENSPCPDVEMGNHCKKPYDCDYQDRCKSLLPKSRVVP